MHVHWHLNATLFTPNGSSTCSQTVTRDGKQAHAPPTANIHYTCMQQQLILYRHGNMRRQAGARTSPPTSTSLVTLPSAQLHALTCPSCDPV